jgi:flagellar basal body-associated protein FliL
LSARSYSELGSLEVKFRVKNEIARRVNLFLRDTSVKDVLFTNFLVQ